MCTCKLCNKQYIDASGSGGGTKCNCGFCSKTCRDAKPKARNGQGPSCKHGRRKAWCKDCDMGHCEHGRQKGRCKDCGTGHCEHGR
jgi:hypothetical protein